MSQIHRPAGEELQGLASQPLVGGWVLSSTLETVRAGQGPSPQCSAVPGLWGGIFWPQSLSLFTFWSFSWCVDPSELPGVAVRPAGWTDCFEELTNLAWFVLATNWLHCPSAMCGTNTWISLPSPRTCLPPPPSVPVQPSWETGRGTVQCLSPSRTPGQARKMQSISRGPSGGDSLWTL